MKNIIKCFGIIVLTAAIGFSFASCDDDAGGGGGPTLGPSDGELFVISIINNYSSAITSIEFVDGLYATYTHRVNIGANGGRGSVNQRISRSAFGFGNQRINVRFADGRTEVRDSWAPSSGRRYEFTINQYGSLLISFR